METLGGLQSESRSPLSPPLNEKRVLRPAKNRDYRERESDESDIAEHSDDGDGIALAALISDMVHEQDEDSSSVYDEVQGYLANAATESMPKSLKQAKASPEWPKWQEAVNSELKSHKDRKTYNVMSYGDKPPGAQVLGSSLLFSEKASGRKKVRLVIMGNQQEAQDPTHLFAPVASMRALRVMWALAAALNREVYHIDISTAFLHAKLPKEEWVYVKPPQGLDVDEHGKQILWQVTSAIYGLASSPKNFNVHLNNHMLQTQKFKRAHSDVCIYTKKKTVVVWYVDDAYGFSVDDNGWKDFESRLSTAFTIGCSEVANVCLSMEVKRDKQGGYTLSHGHMIRAILERAGMNKCRTASAPVLGKEAFKKSARQIDVNGKLDKEAAAKYRSLVCSVLFCAQTTRPDVAFACNKLARTLKEPTQGAWNDLVYMLRYLSGTPDKGLHYDGGTHRTTLTMYVDADFKADLATGRSVAGAVFMLNGAAVAWSSKLQATVAISTSQSEYQALSMGICTGLHLRYMLADLGFPQRTVKVFEDNTAAIFMANTESATKHSQHIDPKYHFCREHVQQRKNFEIEYISTADNVADICTKGLSPVKHAQFSKVMMGSSG